MKKFFVEVKTKTGYVNMMVEANDEHEVMDKVKTFTDYIRVWVYEAIEMGGVLVQAKKPKLISE